MSTEMTDAYGDMDCLDDDGTPYPEHDYLLPGQGAECYRCGAEAPEPVEMRPMEYGYGRPVKKRG